MAILTDKQEQALQIAMKRYLMKEPVTTIAGFAGTGKTFLVKEIIQALDIPEKQVLFTTFTGKAALVLNQKGIPATTIHKAFYISFPNKEEPGSFIHSPREELDRNYQLIVIDEISMVSNELLKVIARHDIPVIALGDPGQLPPIGTDNGLLNNPDIFLDEIVRQEEGNSIIDLSMRIRNKENLDYMKDDNVMIIPREELVTGMFDWADQILCGTNNTRRAINQMVREHKGFEGDLPQIGDKVICLKNYWEKESLTGESLINGTIGNVTKVFTGRNEGILGQPVMVDLRTDYNAIWHDLKTDGNIYKGFAPQAPTQKYDARRRRMRFVPPPLHFDFAYAITTHKSQGSQWNNVLIFEEQLNRANHHKWLYTAVTRAAEKVVIIK